MKNLIKKCIFIFIIILILNVNVIPEETVETTPCPFDQIAIDYGKLHGQNSLSAVCPNGHICDETEERVKWGTDADESPTIMKLFFTIVREDDSTNPATTPEIVAAQVQQLNDDFLQEGIQFEYDWRYYESSEYRVFSAPSYFSLDVMRLFLYVSPETQFNIIATEVDISWTTNPTLFDPQGYQSGSVISTSPTNNQFTAILTRHTLTHEFGHVFGLIHDYWGYNSVSCGNPCAENLGTGPSDDFGDRCSDTPPVPIWGGSTFAGAGNDNCSGLPWPVIPNSNYMNVANNKDNDYFTQQQRSRMLCYLDDYWQHTIAGVVMSADEQFGKAPLTVNFTAESDKNVSDWSWDFGDSSTANTQNVQHEYLGPGLYRVESVIQSDAGEYEHTRNEFVAVHDDSVFINSVSAQVGDTVLVPISMHNFVPVNSMTIPIVTSGNVDLNYFSIALDTNRVQNGFLTLIHYDGFNKRFTLKLDMQSGEFIAPGTGAIGYVRLIVPEGVPDSMFLSIEPYSIYAPTNNYIDNSYEPSTVGGYLHRLGCCTDIRGNVDDDELDIVDISDLVYLVDFMFTSGQAPACPEEANIDGDINELIDITDLVSLVDFMFTGGVSPASCP